MRTYLFFLLLGISVVCQAATTAPVTQPTASSLEVHEWSVFVIDGSTGQLNPEGIITATLPAFVTDHRYGSAGAPAVQAPPVPRRRVFMGGIGGNVAGAKSEAPPTENDEPSPVGIIRLIGSADSKVDVSIQAKGGTFLGSWPKAQERDNELLWRDLSITDSTDTILSGVGANHWFTTLRSGKSSIVSADHAGTEKFLAYDLEMPYPSPLKVKEHPDFSVEISNTTRTPLHDLMLYQGDHDSIRTLAIGDLLPPIPVVTKPTTSPSTAPTTQQWNKMFAATKPAAATRPVLKLTVAPTTQPYDLADAWKPVMSTAGVDAADADVIERLIAKYAFDPHRLTAVYRMDDAEFDRLLPIEIVPQPAKIKRFGLVIIINADPTGGTAIDDLVKQLGDDDWSKRDVAYHTLAGMGPAAKDKLTAASKSADLEIAWRAERLLALSPQGAK